MTSAIFQLPKQTPFSLGALVPGAKAQFYAAGTTTPQSVYTTAALSVAHANPVEADAAGEFPVIYLDADVSYRVQIKTSADVLIYDQDDIGGFDNEIVSEESSAGVTPILFKWRPKESDRYLVPNDASAAADNTAALQALFDPTNSSGFRGKFRFVGDGDTYYFNDRMPCRDGLILDLDGNTLSITKTGTSADTNGGVFHAKRDFQIRNGVMTVNYTQVAGTNTFNALALGGRISSTDFASFYDDLESAPMGDFGIENMTFNMNTGPNSSAIFMLGGLRNTEIRKSVIAGDGTTKSGIFYEFGYATNEAAAADRQTSHCRGLLIDGLEISGIEDTGAVLGAGIRLGGPESATIKRVNQYGGASCIIVSPGEALYYRPWVGFNDKGTTNQITMEQIDAQAVDGTVISISGASTNAGYLSGESIPDEQLTDLISFSLKDFKIDCTDAASAGIALLHSAGHSVVEQGEIVGAAKGYVCTNEAIQFRLDNTNIYDCSSTGCQIGLASNIFATQRLQLGEVSNCHIAGNVGAGLTTDYTKSVEIHNNIFGYSTLNDGAAESTQTNAVNATANSQGVVCRSNMVAGSTSTAYVTTGSGCRGNNIVSPKGISTTSGSWAIDNVIYETASNLGDIGHASNTGHKYVGAKAWVASSKRMYVAASSAAGGLWDPVDGATSITPS